LLTGQPADTAKKIDYLRYCTSLANSPAIICLTETKLNHAIDDVQIAIPGYSLFRRDRDRRGGGVAIYAQNDLSASAIDNCS
jgi:exonuclease III